MRRVVLATVVCLAAVFGPLRYAIGQGEYERGGKYNACISTFYDDYRHGWLTFRNSCDVSLDVLYMARLAPYAASVATVKPGRTESTGQSRSEVAQQGNFHLYVCPEHMLPVDANDRYVSRPNQLYRCKR
jgi:hypothetical protein